jgi:phytoene desaturase
MLPQALVIGSGFAGLSAACRLAQRGFEVKVIEKNEQAGGRARVFESQGFKFDMGPSWYWMPDVFEKFFNKFGRGTSDYYALTRLDPSYSVFFGKDDIIRIPAGEENVCLLFESIERGSGDKLKQFLKEAKFKYEVGINDLVYNPGLSLSEFADYRFAASVFKLDVFKSLSAHVRKFFKDPRLIQLLEFPVLFLGAMPSEIPALYSLMNYADISLGTWYPMGGMTKIVEGMVSLAESLCVQFYYRSTVEKILVGEKNRAKGLKLENGQLQADVIIGAADYHHVEQKLLDKEYRQYSEEYWDGKTLAPSCLIYYLGINKKLKNLTHHNLFFDADFEQHSKEIYKTKKWPQQPLFYVCCPSKTDDSVAPEGCENLFILIPVAVGLQDSEEIKARYLKLVLERLGSHIGEQVDQHIVFQKSYAGTDFITDYNSYKGNAYGLANTILQTANLRPSIRSKKVKNLYYTGQLTVPGPGVPPAIISGQVVAEQIVKDEKIDLKNLKLRAASEV